MKLMPRYTWLLLISAINLCSCSISYQNISTHGTATDLVDETQTTSPDVKADMNADVSFVPKIPYLNGPTGPKHSQ